MLSNNLKLRKKIYSEDDFTEHMWNDNKVHSIIFDELMSSLKLDIDYIIQWEKSNNPDDPILRTWQIPAIITFRDVFNIEVNFRREGAYNQCEIVNVDRLRNSGEDEFYGFKIHFGPMDFGTIVLSDTTSYNMNLIGEPQYCQGSNLDIIVRKKIIKENIDQYLDLLY